MAEPWEAEGLGAEPAALLKMLGQMDRPAISTLAPAEARAAAKAFEQLSPAEPIEVALVTEEQYPGPAGQQAIRVYKPKDGRADGLFVYLHGGGWVLCDLDTYDPLCRELANRTGCVVASVEYRLAPEHRYPSALDDCHAALRWASEQASRWGVESGKLILGGDSAGGNLTAACVLKSRDSSGPKIDFQIAIYPVADASNTETPSYLDNADGFFLTRDDMIWFIDHYLPDAGRRTEPLASPVLADHAGLPPALVITAGFDVLRDEGIAYAEKLRAAEVPVEHLHYPGMIHGFLNLNPNWGDRRDAIDMIANAVDRVLGRE